MYFDKPSTEPATPMATPHHEVPIDETLPGEEMLITKPVIGPSDHMPPAPGSPSTIDPLSIATATRLAARLNWKVGKRGPARPAESEDQAR